MTSSISLAACESPQDLGDNRYYFEVGNCLKVNDKVVKLIDVATNQVVIEVSEVNKILTEGDTQTVNGVTLTLKATYSRTEREESAAELVIGEGQVIATDTSIEECASPQDLGDNKYSFKVGNCLKYEGKVVKLIDVATSQVVIAVDEVNKILTVESSQIINGVELTLEKTHVGETKEDSSAVLAIGEGAVTPTEQLIEECEKPKDLGDNKYYFKIGNCLKVDDKVVKLIDVATSQVVIAVDEVNKILTTGSSQIIDGVKLTLESTHVGTTKEESAATLIIPKITEVPTEGEAVPVKPLPVKPQEGISAEKTCNGCWKKDVCVPIGTRAKIDKVHSYCNIELQWVAQVNEGQECQNSYECKSNECANATCISTYGLIKKIWTWLRNLF